MALQTITGGVVYPGLRPLTQFMTGAAGEFSILLDATGEKAGYIFRAPRTGTIDRLGFRTKVVTTAQTLRVGLEGVDATTGFPNGTQYGGSVVGTQAAPATDTFYEVTLGTGAAVTLGDYVAIVIQFDATVGNLNLCGYDYMGGAGNLHVPYGTHFTAAWAKLNPIPAASVRYNDATYAGIGLLPFRVPLNTTFNSGSTPDEIGNIFTLPGPMRCVGVNFWADLDQPTDIVLYAGDGSTVLTSLSFDPDIRLGIVTGEFFGYWPSVLLAKDTSYRLIYKPTTTTPSILVRSVSVVAAGMLDMCPGGTVWHKTSRTNAGAWTQDTLTRMLGLNLIIDQMDDGVGGAGGLLVHPGMGGGMRG